MTADGPTTRHSDLLVRTDGNTLIHASRSAYASSTTATSAVPPTIFTASGSVTTQCHLPQRDPARNDERAHRRVLWSETICDSERKIRIGFPVMGCRASIVRITFYTSFGFNPTPTA